MDPHTRARTDHAHPADAVRPRGKDGERASRPQRPQTLRPAASPPLREGEATWPGHWLGNLLVSGASGMLRGALKGAEFLKGRGLRLGGVTERLPMSEDALTRWLDQHGWPTRRPLIGVVQAGEWSSPITRAPGVLWPQWCDLRDATPQGDEPRHLDATIRRTHDGLEVQTPERAGLDAAWFDWSQERPLSYPSVFPTRLDCARVTLGAGGLSIDPRVTRLLMEAAVIASRHPSRLSLDDRLAGRAPAWARGHAKTTMGLAVATPDPLSVVLRPLADTISHLPEPRRSSAWSRCAARVLGAWAATTSEHVDHATRRTAAHAAMHVVGDEPQTLLRVGAVLIGEGLATDAMELLLRAARLLEGQGLDATADQVLFVQSELQTMGDSRLALGRVAAGLTLVGATIPASQLAFFRDDFLDDAAHAGILRSNEHARAIVHEVFRLLAIVRSAPSSSVAPPNAEAQSVAAEGPAVVATIGGPSAGRPGDKADGESAIRATGAASGEGEPKRRAKKGASKVSRLAAQRTPRARRAA
jgi:hypothetical protein